VYKPWTDVSKFNNDGSINIGINDKVKFTMKHALASFANEITIKLSDELNGLILNYSDIIVYGIKIEYKNLTTKARLVLNSADGSANWKEVISGELTTTRTYYNVFATDDELTALTFEGSSTTPAAKHIPYLNGGTDTDGAPKPLSTEGDGLFYIPLQIAGQEKATATVTLYYRVKIKAGGTYMPAITDATNLIKDCAEATATFDLVKAPTQIETMAGKKQGLALTLGKDYDLMHLVYTLGGTATEPSYSRLTK